MPSARDAVADRVLHEGVGADDEVAGQPGAGEQRDRGHQVRRAGSAAARRRRAGRGSVDSRKKANSPSIASVCPMTLAGERRESRPVGAELELHRDARDDADDEVDGEDPDPEPRRFVPFAGRPVRSAPIFITTMRSASPIVSCGKM